eukprot:m.238934 g.238934  ORF g.238934 m.238934 type:complete len:510 (+) comp19403_c0_seq1:150-1679(+)
MFRFYVAALVLLCAAYCAFAVPLKTETILSQDDKLTDMPSASTNETGAPEAEEAEDPVDEDEPFFADQEAIADSFDVNDTLLSAERNDEYMRYLKEFSQKLKDDKTYRDQIIADIEQKKETGEELDMLDNDLYMIAKIMFETNDVRSALEEQERDVIQKQRDEIRRLTEQLQDAQSNTEAEAVQEPTHNLEQRQDEHVAGVNNQNDNQNNVANENAEAIHEHRAKMLKEIDERRRKSFKQKTMDREIEYETMLEKISDPAAKQKLIDRHAKTIEKRRKSRGAQPGHEAELMQVWEKDGLEKEQFNPQVFFLMSDSDMNGVLDEKEIEAIHVGEATELHKEDNTDEEEAKAILAEEVARMREVMMEYMDVDGDRLISRKEFVAASGKPDFKENTQWSAVNPDIEVSKEELRKFKKLRTKEFRHQRRMDKRMLDAAEDAFEDLQGAPTQEKGERAQKPSGHKKDRLRKRNKSAHAREDVATAGARDGPHEAQAADQPVAHDPLAAETHRKD